MTFRFSAFCTRDVRLCVPHTKTISRMMNEQTDQQTNELGTREHSFLKYCVPTTLGVVVSNIRTPLPHQRYLSQHVPFHPIRLSCISSKQSRGTRNIGYNGVYYISRNIGYNGVYYMSRCYKA